SGGDIDSDRRLDRAEAADDEPDRDADDNGKAVAQEERPQAVEQRRPELARARELPKRLRDRARVGAEDRIDVAAEYFPRTQQHDQRGDGDDPTRQRAPRLAHPARLRRRQPSDRSRLKAAKHSPATRNLRQQSPRRRNIRAVSATIADSPL